jgi:hypothetical protein
MGLMNRGLVDEMDGVDGYTLDGGLPKADAPEEGSGYNAGLDAAIKEMRKREAEEAQPSVWGRAKEAIVDKWDELMLPAPEVVIEPTPTTAIDETRKMLTEAPVQSETLPSGTVNTVDEAVISAVYETVRQEENGIRSGWSEDTNKWLPHASAEGGTPTIAYGHKFATQAEADSVTASGGITEVQAIEWFQEDMSTAESRAKSQYEEEYSGKSWDTLDVLGKLMLTEVVFNIGTLKNAEGRYDWPSLTTAIHAKDFATATGQLARTYTKPDGTVVSLSSRTSALQGVYEKVLPLTDWSKEDLTNWDKIII